MKLKTAFKNVVFPDAVSPTTIILNLCSIAIQMYATTIGEVVLKLIIWIEEKFLLVMKESMIDNDIPIPKNLIGFKAFKYKTKNIDADAIEGEKEDWDGTLYNLAYKIKTDYENKVFPSAKSRRDAFRIAANKYTYNNGKKVTMKSLEGAWDKNKDLFT